MNIKKSSVNLHNTSKRYAVIFWSAFFVALVAVVVSFAVLFAVLSADTIQSGVFVNDVSIGKLTKEEAASRLADRYSDPLEGFVTLRSGEVTKELRFADLSAEVDVEATVLAAYDLGRTGNIFDRLKEIFAIRKSGYVLAPILACDDVLLDASLSELAASIDSPGQETTFTVNGEMLTITRGVPGNYIDIDETVNRFKETVLSVKDDIFNVNVKKMNPKEPDAAEIHKEICGEPVDASYTVENRQLVIVDEKPGVSFDIASVQAIIDQTPDDVIEIPVTVVPAAVTAEQIKNQLFVDLLGTYTSKYNAGDVSRSHNVSLASQKINQVVLAPGDVFSYNEIVGPRTLARGFKMATVYVGNRSEPGVGGGICQVSSTLFNAVVLADLNIVTRTNHSLPVSYVPLGRDATVSYGSIDFKFSNNTSHPVKIVASASGGYNKISIYGVKENKNRTIEISTEQIGSRAYQLVQKEDPTLAEGTVKVEQKGSHGSTHNTYKIIKENGKVVKTEFLTKSTYVPADRIEIVGTMPLPEAAPSTEPDAPVSGEITESPEPSSVPIPILPPNTSSEIQTPSPEPTKPPVTEDTNLAEEIPAETTETE